MHLNEIFQNKLIRISDPPDPPTPPVALIGYIKVLQKSWIIREEKKILKLVCEDNGR